MDEHKIPEIYLDKEEYSIEPELKKKIYNYVINLRNQFTTGNNLNFKESIEDNKDKGDIDENDLMNLN